MPTQDDENWLLSTVLAFVTLALFAGVGILNFAALNFAKLFGYERLAHYYLWTLGAAVILTVMLKAIFFRVPIWRLALVVSVVTYICFSFHQIEALLKAHVVHRPVEELLKVHVVHRVEALLKIHDAFPSDSTRMIVYFGLVLIMSGLLAFIVLRRPVAIRFMLAAGAALVGVPIVSMTAQGFERVPARDQQSAVVERKSPRLVANVYWIVLDGYPRQDVLRDMFGYDNRPFLKWLESKDFVVVDQSRANFPATIYSIAATLSMNYPVAADGTMTPMAALYPIVRGESQTVARFRSMGYHYVHFASGYDHLTLCEEKSDNICIIGSKGLGEFDVALLSSTPLKIWLDMVTSADSEGADDPFSWGGVDDLIDKLPEIRESPTPFFLYAHVIAPHPPMRLRRDCSRRPSAPDLQAWNPAEKAAFIEQIECTNSQTIALIERIVSRDKNAIVLVQSDHGSAFRGQFSADSKKAAEWDDEDFRERFAVLNAMRLPQECRSRVTMDATLIETFGIVLSCIEGTEFVRPARRFFVSPYDNNPEFGRAVEYYAGTNKQ